MTLDPAEGDAPPGDQAVERLPKLPVQDGAAVRLLPAAALPAEDPLRDAVLQILAVRREHDRLSLGQMAQRLDRRHHLHAVVRRRRIAARKRLHLFSRTHDAGCPAARTVRVAKARAVRIDMTEGIVCRLLRRRIRCCASLSPGRAPHRGSLFPIEKRRQRLRLRQPCTRLSLRQKTLVARARKALHLCAAVRPCAKDPRRAPCTHSIKFLRHLSLTPNASSSLPCKRSRFQGCPDSRCTQRAATRSVRGRPREKVRPSFPRHPIASHLISLHAPEDQAISPTLLLL